MMNTGLPPDRTSSSDSFRAQIERLLICPITQKRLDRPHVIRINQQNGQMITLTVSGSALNSLPNAFEANK